MKQSEILTRRMGDLEAAKRTAPEGSVWRHRNGDLYIVVNHGFVETDVYPCIVYRLDGHSTCWVRPASEFLDGRFTRVDQGGDDTYE